MEKWKRIVALVLAFLLLFTTESEIIYATDVERETGLDSETEEEIYYTVTFDADNGTAVSSNRVKEGEFIEEALLGTPKKEGYLFGGWRVNGVDYDFSSPVKEDITLRAFWIPITYKIRFDGNGGTGHMEDQMFTYDRPAALNKNRFSKRGYVFEGWVLNGSKTYADGTVVENLSVQNEDVLTLKAFWRLGNYKVRFYANGGKGSMKEQAFVYGKSQKLLANAYKRSGYTFTGWNTKKDGTGTAYKNKQSVKSLTDQDGKVVKLYAMWTGVPYQVRYNGNGANSGSVRNSSHIYGTPSRLNAGNYRKKGYTFAGWNTKADGTGTTYQNAGIVTKLTTKKNKIVTLYAKWKAIKYKITYDKKGGTFKKSYKDTYTIATKTFTLPKPTKKGYDFDGWYQDKKYKKRVDVIKQGKSGNIKVYAKWVRCATKAKSNSAKITYCNATGTGKIKVKATVKKRIASSDDYYYLVYVKPNTKQPYKMAARSYKKKKLSFSLKTSENQGYAIGSYRIAVKKGGKYRLISNYAYIKNPERAAKNKSKYRLGKTKKGIQFSSNMKEIQKCSAKNTFLNITTSMVCNGSIPYKYNGKTYYFSTMSQYKKIISECNRKKINVSVQILLDWTWRNTDLIAEKARIPGAAQFYAWNASNNGAREKMEAIFCYLGEIFGKKSCYVSNWILGNEINNPIGWNYKGSMSTTSYFRNYAIAFRSLYYAVRSQYSNAKVFICTDSCWNTSENGYSAKYSIDRFQKELKRLQKGIKWNLAYHAYSYPLTNTSVWNGYGISHERSTPYVTMENLHVLTDYIRDTYGSSVRVILSEQGYSSNSGEKIQAAALAYSYYIAACDPMVDAFIIRSYADHPVEVAQGLSMGIAGKKAFQVFRYMDTKKFEKYTKKYLKVIGAKSWKQIVRRYKKNKIWKMYRKG
ncbi:MAG: InlB B-repeat-containing protein [Lachnospiraceae bacterium]|nr:InlB B-repeat-containing protein [Lachnospiraceae bacterium]